MSIGSDPRVTGITRPRSPSETLVPGDLSAELDAWRSAASWATSDPPTPRALPDRATPPGMTPVHARLAELLIAHRNQASRVSTLERRLVRTEWALIVCALLACLTAGLAALVGITILL